jgi:hypothetical protein
MGVMTKCCILPPSNPTYSLSQGTFLLINASYENSQMEIYVNISIPIPIAFHTNE